MPAYRAREDNFFKVAAFADEVFDGVTMGDADDVLLDDGTVVEDFGYVMARSTNQLYAALKGLMIWTSANEGWQKRMVNVNDALRIAVDEIVGENLHVAREHQKVDIVLLDQRVDLLLGLLLVFFGDRDNGVRNFVEISNGLIVGMVGNDERDFAGEFAALMAIEQIDEAVVVFRNQDDHAGTMRGLRETPLHLKFLGDGRELLAEVSKSLIGEIDVEVFGIELDAHQEESGFLVGVFVGVQDVAAVAVDEVGNSGDFAFAVRTGDEEDGGIFHWRSGAIVNGKARGGRAAMICEAGALLDGLSAVSA